MKSFYDELLKQIDELLEQDNYKQALEMVSEELAMPYIPREVESKLQDMYRLCVGQLRYDSANSKRNTQSVEELLTGNEEEQFMAVEQLRESNIRSYLNVVQEYLSNDPIAMVRALLLEAMYEQGITTPVRLNYEGLEIEVIPALIEPIRESSGLQSSATYLRNWFENDNPSMFQLGMQCLVKEAYLRLPLGIDDDESQGLALAIVEYIYRASDESFDVFIEENDVRNVIALELLLPKHDI